MTNTPWLHHGGAGLGGNSCWLAPSFYLGAISPGPSVMVVIRNTIIGGRSQGVACAIGHGIGFGIYAGSAVFGLIVLLENAPDAFLILQLIGVAFLITDLVWLLDVE